ncbi:hypothetical protein DIPPA_22313 [Diplonema papillatum]|nr:hypothetical protein DIPPA_22313 [Diplonema papillatum]
MGNDGKLEVNVYCAKDLTEKRFSFMGPSATLVEVKASNATKSTSVAEKGLNPVWDETLNLTGIPSYCSKIEFTLKTKSGSEMGTGKVDVSSRGFYQKVPYEDWIELIDNGKKAGVLHVRLVAEGLGRNAPQPPRGLEKYPLNAVVDLKDMDPSILNKELAKVVEYGREGSQQMSVLVLNPKFVKNHRTTILKTRPSHLNIAKWTVNSSNVRLLWDGQALPQVGVQVTLNGLTKNPELNGTKCEVARISVSIPYCKRVYIRTTPGGSEKGPFLPANVHVNILPVGSTIEIAGLTKQTTLNGKRAKIVAHDESKGAAGDIVYRVELSEGERSLIHPRNSVFKSLPKSAAPAAAPPAAAPAPLPKKSPSSVPAMFAPAPDDSIASGSPTLLPSPVPKSVNSMKPHPYLSDPSPSHHPAEAHVAPLVTRDVRAKAPLPPTEERRMIPLVSPASPNRDSITTLPYVPLANLLRFQPIDQLVTADVVIFFAGYVRKINATTKIPSKRTIIVTHDSLILFELDSHSVKRSIRVQDIKEVLLAQADSQFTWVGIKYATYDLLLVMTSEDERKFVRVVQQIYKTDTQRELKVTRCGMHGRNSIKMQCNNLSKPPQWDEKKPSPFAMKRSRTQSPAASATTFGKNIPASVIGGSTLIDGFRVRQQTKQEGMYVISDDDDDAVAMPYHQSHRRSRSESSRYQAGSISMMGSPNPFRSEKMGRHDMFRLDDDDDVREKEDREKREKEEEERKEKEERDRVEREARLERERTEKADRERRDREREERDERERREREEKDERERKERAIERKERQMQTEVADLKSQMMLQQILHQQELTRKELEQQKQELNELSVNAKDYQSHAPPAAASPSISIVHGHGGDDRNPSMQPQPQYIPSTTIPYPPAAASPGSGLPSSAQYCQRVVALYQILDPDKPQSDIQLILEQFTGAEKDLYDSLLERLRLQKPPPAPTPFAPTQIGSPAASAQSPVKHPHPLPHPLSPGSPSSPMSAAPVSPLAAPVPEPKIKLPGAVKAVVIGIDGKHGRTCSTRAKDVEEWITGWYRPQVMAMMSRGADEDVSKSDVLSALRWLGDGCQENDFLFFSFTGEGSAAGLVLPDGSAVAPSEVSAALLQHLPRGVRVTMLIDTFPCSSLLSLTNRLTENSRTANLPGESTEADAAIISSAGGTVGEAGTLTSSFLRVLQHTPKPSHGYLLAEISRELTHHHGISSASPQIQTSLPVRLVAPFAVEGMQDTAPTSPLVLHTSTGPGRPSPSRKESVSGGPHTAFPSPGGGRDASCEEEDWADPEVAEIVEETFRQANDPGHPNHAVAAGTAGAWLMDGNFGSVKRDGERAAHYLRIAVRAGDGPSASKLRQLRETASESQAESFLLLRKDTNNGALDCEESTASLKLRSALTAFCSARAPRMLPNIPGLVAEYRNRETALLKILRSKHADWPWPADEAVLPGPGTPVCIKSDASLVKAAVDSTLSLTWDATMDAYCGASGTVKSVDAAGNVRVNFPDGRTYWWPPEAIRNVGVDNLAALLAELGDGEKKGGAAPGVPVRDDLSKVVRIGLRKPAPGGADLRAVLSEVAAQLEIHPSCLHLLPVATGDGSILRLQLHRVPSANRVARELVARCRNPNDPLSSLLSAAGAELESEGPPSRGTFQPATPPKQAASVRFSSSVEEEEEEPTHTPGTQYIAVPPAPLLPLKEGGRAPPATEFVEALADRQQSEDALQQQQQDRRARKPANRQSRVQAFEKPKYVPTAQMASPLGVGRSSSTGAGHAAKQRQALLRGSTGAQARKGLIDVRRRLYGGAPARPGETPPPPARGSPPQRPEPRVSPPRRAPSPGLRPADYPASPTLHHHQQQQVVLVGSPHHVPTSPSGGLGPPTVHPSPATPMASRASYYGGAAYGQPTSPVVAYFQPPGPRFVHTSIVRAPLSQSPRLESVTEWSVMTEAERRREEQRERQRVSYRAQHPRDGAHAPRAAHPAADFVREHDPVFAHDAARPREHLAPVDRRPTTRSVSPPRPGRVPPNRASRRNQQYEAAREVLRILDEDGPPPAGSKQKPAPYRAPRLLKRMPSDESI